MIKKLSLGLVILLVVIAVFYLTKPTTSNPQPVTVIPAEETITDNFKEAEITAGKPATVTAEVCDSKDLRQQMDALKKERNSQVTAFAEQVTDKSKLKAVVLNEFRDYGLANEIQANTSKQPLTNATAFKSKQGQKLLEEIMMAAFAGQGDQYISKFFKGELATLDPSGKDRDQLFGVLAMGGEEAALRTIDRLYPKQMSLSVDILPAVFGVVKDRAKLKAILQRVHNVNWNITAGAGFYYSTADQRPINAAISNSNYAAVELLLELEHPAKPLPAASQGRRAIDNFLYPDKVPPKLLQKMLDKGFRSSNSRAATRLAKQLEASQPELAAKFHAQSRLLKQQEANLTLQMPNELQAIISDYKNQHTVLNQQYLDCLITEKSAKPKIPPYQPLNKLLLEQEIDQLLTQKMNREQIILSLAAKNKESVEHGYNYLRRLKQQSRTGIYGNFGNLPPEMRQLIGFYKDKKWQQMVDLMAKTKFDPALELSPASMIPEMIKEGAPNAAISAMVAISDKNDIKLLHQAQYRPELMEKIAAFGFNIDARDESNKNLFYQAVKRGNTEQVERLMGYGVSMISDPYGYDPLDLILRKPKPKKEILSQLGELGFPISSQHHDYALYLKRYYPERYQSAIKALPSLATEGEWQPKSD